ncbi:MAG TPA: cytochrome c biogenesis CcdA family protein [Acidimicrobiia bacterium]
MAEASLFLQVLIAFGGGVVSFLSPCVLPLVPGYLSMMSGYSAAAIDVGAVSRARLLRVAGLFIAGFTVVFVAFGATATALGRFLAANMPIANRIAGAVVTLFGLLVVALAVTNRGPLAWFSRDVRPDVRPSRLGGWAPPVMGAAFAFGWTPCIGPILSVVLTTAAVAATVGRGMVLLVAYSLGLGLPFVLVAVGVQQVFRRIRRHLRTINIASGMVMAAFGIVMLTGNLNRIASYLVEVMVKIPWLENLSSI